MPVSMEFKITEETYKDTFKDIMDEVLDQAAEVAILGISRGIADQEQPNGMPQKRNTRQTIKSKEKRRVNPIKSLVDEGILIDEKTYYIQKNKENRIIGIKPTRAEIAAKLEENGYYFFDITRKAWTLINLVIEKELEKAGKRVKKNVIILKSA